jgi:hypothetical protein
VIVQPVSDPLPDSKPPLLKSGWLADPGLSGFGPQAAKYPVNETRTTKRATSPTLK